MPSVHKPFMFSFEPRCQGFLGVAEIDLNVGRQREAPVTMHFCTSIPGQGFIELEVYAQISETFRDPARTPDFRAAASAA
jgi:hypothetical protein